MSRATGATAPQVQRFAAAASRPVDASRPPPSRRRAHVPRRAKAPRASPARRSSLSRPCRNARAAMGVRTVPRELQTQVRAARAPTRRPYEKIVRTQRRLRFSSPKPLFGVNVQQCNWRGLCSAVSDKLWRHPTAVLCQPCDVSGRRRSGASDGWPAIAGGC
eukprot:6191202-Pleurochrysis_carterae.AAC.4